MLSKVLFSSKSEDWATPQIIFDELNKEFNFTLDPCADEFNHKCNKYYTKIQNGLSKNWEGETVFCNPPYGKEICKWVQKCYTEVILGECLCAVMLIPARTDTRWFHEYIYNKADEVRFIKGRLKFGDSKQSAPFPSMVVVFKQNRGAEMETTGKLVDVTRDFRSGKLNVTFQIDTEPIDDINAFGRTSDVLDIVAKKHREKRSLDANAYFHVLVGKIADKENISKPRCKNILIGRYGQQELLEEGQPVILKTNMGVDKMLEQEVLHCQACGCKVENGTEVVFYKVFRGSHTYNTKEMSVLIDGTVQEAKDLGIETLSPDKLAEMMNKWKPKEM